MNGRLRRLFAAGFSALAVVLGAAALAWACVPSSTLNVSPDRGPAGTTVTVSSSEFQQDGPVQILWDGNRQLGTTTAVNRSFSTTVATPSDASPGVHYITARSAAGGEHAQHGQGTAPFEVTGAAAGGPGAGTGASPGAGTTPGAPTTTRSRRARAIAACKRRYRSRSRASKRKRAACIRRAKRRYRA